MFFTRVASVFAVIATLSALVLANPLPSFDKRQDNSTTDIEGILNALKSSTDTILPQISALGSGGNATSASLDPLLGQLDTALNTASTSLKSVPQSSKVKRQSESDIATLTAGIITDITNALDSLLGDAAAIPELGSLFAGVDASLNQVLVGLETLLAGVLNLVANLLTDVSGLLSQLAFGLTLASLGL